MVMYLNLLPKSFASGDIIQLKFFNPLYKNSSVVTLSGLHYIKFMIIYQVEHDLYKNFRNGGLY